MLNDPWIWYIGLLCVDKNTCVQMVFLHVYSQLTGLKGCSFTHLFLYWFIWPATLDHLLRTTCCSSDMAFIEFWSFHPKKSWFVQQKHILYSCFLFLNDHKLSSALRTASPILFDSLFSRHLSQPSLFLPSWLKFAKNFLPFNWAFLAMIKPIITPSFLYSKISMLGLIGFYFLGVSKQSKMLCS